MSAVGKVYELDGDHPKYPGKAVVTLVCSLEEGRAWAALFGETVRAEQLAVAPGQCGCAETYPQLVEGELSHGPGCPQRPDSPQQGLPGVER